MTESELMINVSSEPVHLPKKKKNKFSGKVSRNRKRRIEQRRKFRKKIVKKQNKTDEKRNSNENENSEPKKNDGDMDVHLTNDIDPPKHITHSQKRPFSAASSSIFSGNPDIPEINLPKLKKPKISNQSKCDFSKLNLHDGLQSYITDKLHLKEMTLVQSESLPLLLKGEDALIKSQTGSGKTLAYAVAIMQTLQALEPEVTRETGPLALILTPTRELAQQSYAVFQQLTLPIRRIVATWLVGGQNRKSEKARIRKGVNIIISTPGRFIDHLENTSCLSLAKVRWLVFDEADRILDMGFQRDIQKVLDALHEQTTVERQTVLLSATLNKGVESLVDLALKNPKTIDVTDSVGDSSNGKFVDPATGLYVEKASLPDQLQQFIAIIPSKLRLVSLLAFLLLKHETAKILIFLSCRDSVQFHFELVQKFFVETFNEDSKNKILQLHGGMQQIERTKTVSKFKRLTSSILLCTDVAARGLDLPSVDWVLQYTSPGNPVDYIHRVGRSARAGHAGNALLFLTPTETPYVKLLSSYDIPASLMKVEELLAGFLNSKESKLQYNVRTQLARENASKVHKNMETQVARDRKLKDCAVKAFVAFIRAYATYPLSLKHIFHVKNLHIGHVAKSFALQETPSEALAGLQKTIGEHNLKHMQFRNRRQARVNNVTQKQAEAASNKATNEKPVEKEKVKKQKLVPKAKNPILAKFDIMSEFSSGL